MTVLRLSCPAVEVDPKQVCRYLGIAPSRLPPELQASVEEAAREVGVLGQWTALYLLLPVEQTPEGVRLGPLELPGLALQARLRGCAQAALYCATAGAAFDRRLRALRLRPSRQTLWDAAGTAGIEAFCDLIDARFPPGPPRFSPGYRDLKLEHQRQILRLLGADRIGLGLTDSLLMTPTKSVTAIKGIFLAETGLPADD